MGVETIALAALATATVSTGVSVYQGKKAAGYQKEAVNIQRQQAKLQDQRSRRDAIRASRLAYAQAQAAAENQGVATSSSAQGGQSSIVSQVNDNLSFLDQYARLSDRASTAIGNANSAQASARLWSNVTDLAMTAAQYSPQISQTAQKVFRSS